MAPGDRCRLHRACVAKSDESVRMNAVLEAGARAAFWTFCVQKRFSYEGPILTIVAWRGKQQAMDCMVETPMGAEFAV